MIRQLWKAVLEQDKDSIKQYFHDNAYVNWHCTNEHFTVDEFIRANCAYPGKWEGDIERIENTADITITVVRVYPKDRSMSFHVVSFVCIQENKIVSLDEYWADDSVPPQWRQKMNIGSSIK